MAARDIEAGRAHVLLSIRDKMTQGLKLAEKRFQQFGRYAATTGAVMSGGAFAALAWPVKLSADMEQASVAMEVFLGSASAAKKMISDIEMMAAKTPFRFDELKDAANLLLGFGAQGSQIIPMLNLLGDASRGNSESFARLSLAFGQTMAKGRLMGQEVLQMTEQGFNPLFWISKQTGKSMEALGKEMESGQLSFSMLVQAFQYATGPMGKFNNMMAKQSQTLTGLTSSFLDFFSMIARSVGDTLVPMFKDVLTAANSIAIGFTAIIKANSKLVGTIAKAVLIVGLIGGALISAGVAAMSVSFVLGLLASGLAAITSIILAPISLIGLLASGFMGIVGAVASIGTAIVGIFTALPAMLAAIFSPMGVLIAAFIGAGVAAYYYRDAVGETLRGIVALITPSIGSLSDFAAAFGRVWEAAGSAVQGITDALSTGDIALAGSIALGALKAMFYQALAEIPGIGRLIASGFGQALLAGRWDLMAEIGMANIKLALLQGWNSIKNLWSASVTALGATWDIVVYAVRSGWNVASNALASGMLWVVGKIGDAITVLQIMFDGMWTSIQTMAVGLKVLFTEGIDAAQQYGKAMGEQFRDRTTKRLRDNAASKVGNQKTLIEDAARMEASIRRDFENSMMGRVNGEQSARSARAAEEATLRSKIAVLNGQAGQAAKDAGVSTAQDAAWKARFALAEMTDDARNKATAKGADAANRIVPGIAGKTGLPKVESRGTFSAAAAAALGGRSNAQEATARNTAMANKLLRVIADKRGPQFT